MSHDIDIYTNLEEFFLVVMLRKFDFCIHTQTLYMLAKRMGFSEFSLHPELFRTKLFGLDQPDHLPVRFKIEKLDCENYVFMSDEKRFDIYFNDEFVNFLGCVANWNDFRDVVNNIIDSAVSLVVRRIINSFSTTEEVFQSNQNFNEELKIGGLWPYVNMVNETITIINDMRHLVALIKFYFFVNDERYNDPHELKLILELMTHIFQHLGQDFDADPEYIETNCRNSKNSYVIDRTMNRCLDARNHLITAASVFLTEIHLKKMNLDQKAITDLEETLVILKMAIT